MASLKIHCPRCGERLKLPDRSLLGRKGKCGRCRHKFVMQESDEARPAKRRTITRGKTTTAQIEFAELPEFASANDNPADAPELAAATEQAPPGASATAEDEADPTDPFAVLELAAADPESGFRRMAVRSSSAGRRVVWAGATILLLLAGGSAAWWFSGGRFPGHPSSPEDGIAAVAGEDAETADSTQQDASAPGAPDEELATPQPIPFTLVPMGARVVIHLRPAELWAPGSAGDEFRACLGPLGVWLEQELQTRCLIAPDQIESALFALIPVSREEFDAAVVVRAVEPLKRSELVSRFDGELRDDPAPHYLGSSRVYLIQDSRTLAIAPREMAESLLDSIDGGGVASEGIEALLPHTDRRSHLTILAEIEDVATGLGTLSRGGTAGLIQAVLDFLGEGAETAAWSLRLGDAASGRDLTSELLVRNRGTQSPPALEKALRQRLAAAPESILRLVQRCTPQTVGEGKIIGRFPILTKVVEQSAEFATSRRHVELRWRLSERAGPNLALGALLTWNQTTLPGYEAAAPPPSASGTGAGGQPPSIAQRLQKRIDVDFRDDFLFVAVNFIGDETGVQFTLDGTGMRRAGVTQNEKQKFALQGAPAGAVLNRILSARGLVLIVDETKQSALITGAEEAADRGWTPFALPPPP